MKIKKKDEKGMIKREFKCLTVIAVNFHDTRIFDDYHKILLLILA